MQTRVNVVMVRNAEKSNKKKMVPENESVQKMSWRKQRRAMEAKVQAAEDEARQLRQKLEEAASCVVNGGGVRGERKREM